MKIPLLKSRP